MQQIPITLMKLCAIKNCKSTNFNKYKGSILILTLPLPLTPTFYNNYSFFTLKSSMYR